MEHLLPPCPCFDPTLSLRCRPLLLAAAALCFSLLLVLPPAQALGPSPLSGRILSTIPSTGDQHWVNQTLDHFSFTDKRTFQQRYFEVLDHASGPDSPILLYICGEAPCGGVPTGFLMELAEHFGAPVVALEHRFYGETQPFEDLSTPHLAYLSTHQALADLAFFRQFYQAKWCARHTQREEGRRSSSPQTSSSSESSSSSGNRRFMRGVGEGCGNNKWIVVGGSYAGAMSAWLRLKYPHLFHASLASSAVVDVILEFYQFDQQVLESAGPECGPLLQQVTREAEALLQRNRTQALAMFKCDGMKDTRDFLFLLADAAVFAFQYGRPDAVCAPLLAAHAGGASLLETFANYTKSVFFDYYNGSPIDYDQEYLKQANPPEHPGMRAWYYQTCTEMAYFQVAPANNSVRSSAVDLQYWRDFCSNVFGDGIFPDTAATNTFYGSTRIAGSRIVFANGSQDPWKRASKLKPSQGEPSIVVPCHNCGHCVDLRGCPPALHHSPPIGSVFPSTEACTDVGAVQLARAFIRDTLTEWLQEPALESPVPQELVFV